MNPNTNEVKRKMPAQDEGFLTLPEYLQKEAKDALKDKDSVIIPKESNSPLAKWALKIRKSNYIGKQKQRRNKR